MRRRTHLRKPLLWLVLLLVAFPVSATAGGTPYGQAAPTNSTAPSISGSAVLGQTLTANPGAWSGVSLSYAHQWLRCDTAGNGCAAIAGAGSASYAISSADVGWTLRVAVIATNKNGALTVASNPTSVVAPPPAALPAAPPASPQNTALPQITGVAQSGQTLTGSAGTWSGSPTSYGYQWQRCDSVGASCANVAGATSTSYGVGTVDVGATLRFVVSATNVGGTTSASSGATAAVTAATVVTSPPANTALPQVTGTAQVAQTLTTSNGTWSGTPTSYAYQWRRCDSAGANCANVLAATASTYKLATGDAGATFRAAVTATNAAGSSTAASAPTAAALIPSAAWTPPTNTTWQWQLSGVIDQSVDVAVYDIDLFDNGSAVVDSLHRQGRKAICYFSAGSWEDWRPDAASFPASVLGNRNGWPGERWIDIRRLDVLGPIMEARLDLCKQKGFDAAEPDNVDGYTNSSGFSLTADDQLRYNRFLADAAHRRGLSVGLKNDVDQVALLVSSFDWALNEECFRYNECSLLTPFVDAGKAVFQAEYGTDQSYCSRARTLRLSSIQKHLELDAWRTAC